MNCAWKELLDILQEIQESSKGFTTFQEWFDYMEEYKQKLQEQAEKIRLQTDAITISTLHSVKGLEYDRVYILDVNEGTMPYHKAVLTQELEEERREQEEEARRSPLSKSVSGLVWAIGLAAYFLISFATLAWHITWVIFPILGAVEKLLTTIIENKEAKYSAVSFPSQQKLRKSIGSIIGAAALALYFIVSFATGAWYITWLIFPIAGAVKGLLNAILDYKEAVEHEA